VEDRKKQWVPKITKNNPIRRVSAETAAAITLALPNIFGIPVSTTHTITGSIIGVGLTQTCIGRALGSNH